jgi:HTH-type transcriptional regulator/antitoxin HigA
MKCKTKNESMPFSRIPKRYAELVRFHPPRPLHDAIDYRNALAIVLALAGHELTPDQDDYLDLMSDLIEQYDRATDEIAERSTPLQRLKFAVAQAEMSASDLGRLLGNRGLGSVLLNGKRELSKAHIRVLADHLKINPGYLL